MTTNSINTASCEFRTNVLEQDNNKRIILKAKTKEFIRETFQLLAEYTLKIAPNTKLLYGEIKKIPNSRRKKYKFQAEMQGLLPRHVRTFFGDFGSDGRPKDFPEANCHGTALFTSGFLPIPIHVNFSPFQGTFRKKLEEIPLTDVDKGDIVLLNREKSHSFVYLSCDLCLSMNGINQPLNLYETAYVLNKYGYPADFLTKPLSDKKVVVYRKNKDEKWADDVPQELIAIFYPLICQINSEKTPQGKKALQDAGKDRWQKFYEDLQKKPEHSNAKEAIDTLYRYSTENNRIKAEKNPSRDLDNQSKIGKKLLQAHQGWRRELAIICGLAALVLAMQILFPPPQLK